MLEELVNCSVVAGGATVDVTLSGDDESIGVSSADVSLDFDS